MFHGVFYKVQGPTTQLTPYHHQNQGTLDANIQRFYPASLPLLTALDLRDIALFGYEFCF